MTPRTLSSRRSRRWPAAPPRRSAGAARGRAGARAASMALLLPPTCGDEQQAGRVPQRVVGRQRLGVDDVERSPDPPAAAAPRPARRCPRPGPRAMLTSSAPSLRWASISASKSPMVSSVPGTIRTTTSASRQQRRAASSIGVHPLAGATARPGRPRPRTAGPGPRSPRRSGRSRRSAPVLSASDSRVPAPTRRASWARTKSGTPRRLARISVSVSSAVEVSWMPRPLHSGHAARARRRMCSTPADRVCTTFSRGSWARRSPSAGRKR